MTVYSSLEGLYASLSLRFAVCALRAIRALRAVMQVLSEQSGDPDRIIDPDNLKYEGSSGASGQVLPILTLHCQTSSYIGDKHP